MTQAISDKTHVLYLFGGDRFFLNEKEAELIKQAISRGDKYIDLGSAFIATNQVVKILHHADFMEAERIKRGDYKCPNCDNWIPKGMQCGYFR